MLSKIKKFFYSTIKVDGMVTPFRKHWCNWFLLITLAASATSLILLLLGLSGVFLCAIIGLPVAFVTHRADKRINGGTENDES